MFNEDKTHEFKAAILEMLRETCGESYEMTRSHLQTLKFEYVTDYFAGKGVAFGSSQKKTLGLLGDDEMFTNLALLLSEECPHSIKVGVFGGLDKASFLDRREFSGSLLRQLEDVFAFVNLHNPLRFEYDGLERKDERGFPVNAIREALLNAMVHRDYGLSASTLVNIFPDRIEVVSIGGLVKGISLSDIFLGISALRNPRLANIFYRLQLVETYGTGIAKIMGSYIANKIQPEIVVSDNAFKVILPNLNKITSEQKTSISSTKVDIKEEKILSLIRERGRITRKEIQEATGMSQSAAILLLRIMLNKNSICKMGHGKFSTYQAVQPCGI